VTTGDWIAAAAVIVAALGVGLPLLYAIIKDSREREQSRLNAVIESVREDRNYYRSRADQLEGELRHRDEERHD
jgi:NAD(P)H-flavin reductase